MTINEIKFILTVLKSHDCWIKCIVGDVRCRSSSTAKTVFYYEKINLPKI